MSEDLSPGRAQVALADLAPAHYAALERVIVKILHTDLSFDTFAQIVDGFPTRHRYEEYYGSRRDDFQENEEPSQAAADIVNAYRQALDVRNLWVDAKVAQLYQNTSEGSKEFVLRLVELVAVLCHSIAAELYLRYDGGIRKPDFKNAFRTPSPPPPSWAQDLLPVRMPPQPPPTEFFHLDYWDWEQYPNGKADMVGYWAEYRLFGGVVLFDRGDTGTECKDVFIHPVGGYMIFQLSETQIQQFATLALSDLAEHDKELQGLPFKAEKWARRVDPYDAFAYLNIYRDRFERRIPEFKPRRCIVFVEDVPGYQEAIADFARRTSRNH